jgi:hypothetical protein
MSEKHAIRTGVTITVVGGGLLALAIYVGKWFLGFLGMCWSGLWSFLGLLVGALGVRWSVPVWLLVLLVPMASPVLLRLARKFRKDAEDAEDEPWWKSYTKDEIFGVPWRWTFGQSGVEDLWAYCAVCDAELTPREKRHDYHPIDRMLFRAQCTEFICERCSIGSEEIRGDRNAALNSVVAEIRRRIRTEEPKVEVQLDILAK